MWNISLKVENANIILYGFYLGMGFTAGASVALSVIWTATQLLGVVLAYFN